MHELSIAMSIVEMASEEAQRHGGAKVIAIYLKLGSLSGVVKEALLFSHDVACAGTALEGAKLIIEEVPVTIFCHTCEAERAIDSVQYVCCPVCDTPAPDVRGGRELQVTALEIEE